VAPLCEVFISYGRADRRVAERVHAHLQARGVASWYDALIAPGADWRDAIVACLSEARVMIVLLSATALESEELKKELAVADQEDVPFVVARLERVKPRGAFAYELARSNWFDVVGASDTLLEQFADEVAALVREGGRLASTLEASVDARRERRRRESWGRFGILRSSRVLAAIVTGLSLIVLVLYERRTNAYATLTAGGLDGLTATLYIVIAATIGSPLMVLSGLRASRLWDWPLIAAAAANTGALVMLAAALWRDASSAFRRALRTLTIAVAMAAMPLPLLAAQPVAATSSPPSFGARWIASRELPRPTLLVRVRDADPVNRQLAVLQLAEAETPTAEELGALVRALSDPAENVRLQAAAGLARHGPRASPLLARALADFTVIAEVSWSGLATTPRTARLTVSDMALAVLTYAREIDTTPLLKMYRTPLGPAMNEHVVDTIRQRVVFVLRHGHVPVSAALLAALRDADEPLALAVSEVAARSGPAAAAGMADLINAIAEHESRSIRGSLVSTVFSLGPSGIEALRGQFETAKPDVRASILAHLPLEPTSGAALLAESLGGVEPVMREAALARIDSEGWTARALYVDDDRKARAQRLLQSIPDSILTTIRPLLSDPQDSVRRLATTAIAGLAEAKPNIRQEVVETLAGMLDDPASGVRQDAADAMASLAESGVTPESAAGRARVLSAVSAPSNGGAGMRCRALTLLAGLNMPAAEHESAAEIFVSAYLAAGNLGCPSTDEVLRRQVDFQDVVVSHLGDRLGRPSPADEVAIQLLLELQSRRPGFLDVVERLLVQRTDWIQVEAARMLVANGRPSTAAIERLAEAAVTHDRTRFLELTAAATLASVPNVGLVRLLRIAESSRTPLSTRQALVRDLLGRAATTNDWIANWLLAVAAGRIPALQPQAVSQLPTLRTKPAEVRRAIVSAFRRGRSNVRLAAIDAAARAGIRDADLLNRAIADPNPDVRKAAASLASQLATSRDDAVHAIARAVTDPVADVRTEALSAAAAMGTPGADVLATVLRRRGATPQLLAVLGRLETASPRLVAELERRSSSSPGLRAALDHLLMREGAMPVFNRARFRRRLDSKHAADRLSAARVLAAQGELWTADGRLLAILLDHQIRGTLREHIERLLEKLYTDPPLGPGMGLQAPANIPKLPWPPPAGYSALALPRSLLALNLEATFGDVHEMLVKALRNATSGFTQGLFTIPGGFALVARMERVRADGTPLPEPARWMTEGAPKLSLIELLGDLFFERPGYFRVIVFAVTHDAHPGKDPSARLPDAEDGAPIMPSGFGREKLADRPVLALIYAFERRPSANIQLWKDGGPSPLQHLLRAGLWAGADPR
jgi:hypothetical protein